MKENLVVVADHAHCRFFLMPNRNAPLIELEDIIDPEGRKPAAHADRPGRSFDRTGAGRHSMEPETNQTQIEATRLARHIGKRLDEMLSETTFNKGIETIFLVAGPDLLGTLRHNLSDNIKKRVQEIPKNLGTQNEERIREALP